MTTTTHTPYDHQVWPSLRPAPTSKPAPVPWEDREPVNLDEVKVGDTLAFLAMDLGSHVVKRVGEVTRINAGAVVLVQTECGRCVLTKRNWERRAPRR